MGAERWLARKGRRFLSYEGQGTRSVAMEYRQMNATSIAQFDRARFGHDSHGGGISRAPTELAIRDHSPQLILA